MAKKKKKLSDKRLLRDFFQSTLEGRRTAPPACRHFGDCGGCEFQDVPYSEQLAAKSRAFAFIHGEVCRAFREKADGCEAEEAETAAALRRQAAALDEGLAGIPVELEPSPLPLGYRQRMDYVFAFDKAGLRRVNRHRQVVELEECPLLGEQGYGVFRDALRLAREAGLESYDYMRHTGELRYFVVRRARSGQTLLSLVTKSDSPRQAVLGILAQLVESGVVTSGNWLLAPGLGDVSFGERLETVGAPFIVEDMNGFGLRIGPNTFFQSNPAVAEKAYAAIRDFVPPGGTVLDMYSGVASIAVNVSPLSTRVTAVENVPENVALAEVNIGENDIDNVDLLVDDSAQYLRNLGDAGPGTGPDMVIVNPPRPGVEGDGMRAILRLAPRRLAYLSCNPFTLLRNLSEILDSYRLRTVRIYDMFPQTRHFETLALLERTD